MPHADAHKNENMGSRSKYPRMVVDVLWLSFKPRPYNNRLLVPVFLLVIFLPVEKQ